MNEFAKRMTVGFILALLIAVLISYGGMKRKVMPLYEEEFDQQSICAELFQDLKAMYGNISATTLVYDHYARVYFPLSGASAPETLRAF